MKIKRELITYLISGAATTGVNYLLYMGFLAMHIPYLAANSAAWAGAVITAYILNRRLVFHSEKHVAGELASFAALRFITLIVEKCAPVAAHQPTGHSRFSGKSSGQRDHRDRKLCIV